LRRGRPLRPAGESILGIPRMRPMLAGVATVPFDSDDWLFEVKWDGYRCLAYLSDHGLYLDSRNGHPLLPQFPGLSALQSALEAKTALLDGEIVALKDGRVDFSRLRSGAESVVFIAFDILYLDGQLLLEAPLVRRRETLKGVMAWGGVAVLSEAIDGEGKALFSWARERDIEGVMAKRKGGLYYPGERRDEWLKIKNVREGVFWVVGYGPSPGRRLGSLLIAEKRGDGYVVVGKVSSGLNRYYEGLLLEVLGPLEAPAAGVRPDGARPPPGLRNLPPKRELRGIRWVAPSCGVEVEYTELTPDGRLRHPVFKEVVMPGAK